MKIASNNESRQALACTWREACEATDEVLTHFGDQKRDRGIWIWYCRRIGVDRFIDLAFEVESCWKQGELKFPVPAFHRHLQETFPKGG